MLARHLARRLLRPVCGCQSLIPVKLPLRVLSCNTIRCYTKRILSTSTMFVQDGSQIQELPIIVRHTDFSLFGDGCRPEVIKEETIEDSQFKKQLLESNSTGEVLKLLNIPTDQVTAYSAAFALERLCQLESSSHQKLSSFIQTAVLNELCHTATKNIQSLTNTALLNLIHCCLISENYAETYVQRIQEEAERRVGDSKFSILELCKLLQTLCSGLNNEDLIHNTWIHIGNRSDDIDERNIVQVYSMTKYMTAKQKYLMKLFNKRLESCWWKLECKNFTSIVMSLVSIDHRNLNVLNTLGKWTYMNVHYINDVDLAQMIAAYSYYHFKNANFLNALERYFGANISQMNLDLIALTMEYLRQMRHISPRIFDAVALHFERHSETYNSTQVFLIARPFGQLNYEPPNSALMFAKLEEILLSRFDNFSPANMVELLSSFVYLKRLPVNFINKVFNMHFLALVNRISDPATKGRVSRQLSQFQCAVKLEMDCFLPYLFMDNGQHYLWLDARQFCASEEITSILNKIVGVGNFSSMVAIISTPYHVDFELIANANSNISLNGSNRVVLTVLLPEFFCSSHNHLMGEYAMRQRHLRLLGYKVVEVFYRDFCKSGGFAQKAKYISSLLRPYVRTLDADRC